MEKRKKTIIQSIICIGLVCVIWGGYFYAIERKDRQIVEIDDDFSWVYQIDTVDVDEGELILKGFAFQLNRDAVGDNYEIVLKNINRGDNYFLKMEYWERRDVNDYFLCEYDYLQSGFEARIKEKKLNLQDEDYEIFLRPTAGDSAYRTGVYLTEGKIVYANPQMFEALDASGTELSEIVDNGVLRVYRPDYGMYVYQYKGELYWITKEEYPFDEDGNTIIEYQLETTQINRLPEIRLENKWYWDNLGFFFKEKEMTGGNIEGYRVAKSYIPETYSITKIWTGLSKEVWIWKQDFRPYYSFE